MPRPQSVKYKRGHAIITVDSHIGHVTPKELHDIDMSVIPQTILNIACILSSEGYDTYLHGGSTRDLMLRRNPRDWDLATNAPAPLCEKLFGPRKEEGFFSSYFYTVPGLDIKKFDTGDSLVELSCLARPPKEVLELCHVKANTSDAVLADSCWGDFSINALYLNLTTGDLLDFHDGLACLIDRVLDTMGDPVATFEACPSRYLRTIRLLHKLDGFAPSNEVAKALLQGKRWVSQSSRVATFCELSHLFVCGQAESIFSKFVDEEIIEAAFPRSVMTQDPDDFCHELVEMAARADAQEWDTLFAMPDLDIVYFVAHALAPRVRELASSTKGDKNTSYAQAVEHAVNELGVDMGLITDNRFYGSFVTLACTVASLAPGQVVTAELLGPLLA